MPSVNTLLIAIQISSLIRCFPGRFPGEALEVLGPGKIRDEREVIFPGPLIPDCAKV